MQHSNFLMYLFKWSLTKQMNLKNKRKSVKMKKIATSPRSSVHGHPLMKCLWQFSEDWWTRSTPNLLQNPPPASELLTTFSFQTSVNFNHLKSLKTNSLPSSAIISTNSPFRQGQAGQSEPSLVYPHSGQGKTWHQNRSLPKSSTTPFS